MIFRNAHIISADLDVCGSVRTERGIITEVACGRIAPRKDETEVDCHGQFLCPGLIDIHMHGALGYHWADGTSEAIRTLAEYKLREGVTTVLPTLAAMDKEQMRKCFAAFRTYASNAPEKNAARLPGVHLEGPFLNPEAVGAQNPAFVRHIDADEIFSLDEIFPVKRITVAPEMPDVLPAISSFAARGISVSAGHSKATFRQIVDAACAGADSLCHFGNQMTPLHHREIGMVGAGFLMDKLKVELIADRVHVCPEMLRLTAKIKTADRIVLITDSERAAGLPENTEISNNGLTVVVRNGELRLKQNGALAGSALRLNHGFRNFIRETGMPLAEAIKCVTSNPAELVNLKDTGRISPGYRADMVVFSDTWEPLQLFMG